MQEKQITKYRLAKLLGVHQTTVKNWLDGKTEPKFDMIEKIANALNITTDDLMVDDINIQRQNINKKIEKRVNYVKKVMNESDLFEKEDVEDFSHIDYFYLSAESLVNSSDEKAKKVLLSLFRSMPKQGKIECLAFALTRNYDLAIKKYTAPDSSTASDHEEGEGSDKTDTPR